MRRLGALASVAVIVAACSMATDIATTVPGGGATTVDPAPAPQGAPPPAPLDLADRIITITPGDLPPEDVEAKLAAEVDGYLPESGTHVASFDGAAGRIDIFEFKADNEDREPVEGIEIVCRAAVQRDRVIEGFGCSGRALGPLPAVGIDHLSTSSGGGTTSLLASVGTKVEQVLLEFDTGGRWVVLPAGGVVYAVWPWGHGTVVRVTSYTAAGVDMTVPID